MSRPKLLDCVRTTIRLRHYSRRTEEAYVHWIRRYILFHGKRHPSELAAPDVTKFLGSLAAGTGVAASTQNQALSAIQFLYREVLRQEPGAIEHVPRAKTPTTVPVVMSPGEVQRVLVAMSGTPRLIASVLYGAGLRLQECLELPVKDLDFDRQEITVRRGKGGKDRRVMLPDAIRDDLARHIDCVRHMHESDLAEGFGRVVLPGALAAKFPNAATEFRW